MSFGSSVGDIIAISRLILIIVDALDSDTGSKAQYSRLSDELRSLHSAFQAVQDVVQKLRRDEKSHASTINAITLETGCCRKLIEDFNADTKKYRQSLCHDGSGSKVKDVLRKIGYKFFKEEDVVMLKDSLRGKVEVINLWLLGAVIHSVLSLEDKVSGVELITQKQHPKIPKELGCGIGGSITLQDALGRTFPVPFVVCATPEMFHGFLELSFRGRPGHRKVLSRDYSINDEESQKDITPTEWDKNITPGRFVSMSMLFRHLTNAPGVTDFKSKCPRCETPGVFSAAGSSRGWTQCKFCQLWAQYSKERPPKSPVSVLEPRYDKPLSPSESSPSSLLLSDMSAISKELSPFRRVKIVEVSHVSHLSRMRFQRLGLRDSPGPIKSMALTIPIQIRVTVIGRLSQRLQRFARKGIEEGWLSISKSRVSKNGIECLVTIGREVIEDGMPDEQSMDG